MKARYFKTLVAASILSVGLLAGCSKPENNATPTNTNEATPADTTTTPGATGTEGTGTGTTTTPGATPDGMGTEGTTPENNQ